MNKRFTALATTFFVLLATSLAFAEDEEKKVDDAYRKLVSSLLESMGARAVGEQVSYAIAQETLAAYAATGTEITEPMQQIVVEEALAEFAPSFGDIEYLTGLYAPIYAQHFSKEELKTLADFYASPVGQKSLTTMPQIGQAAGMSLQQASMDQVPDFQAKVDKRLREAGIIAEP